MKVNMRLPLREMKRLIPGILVGALVIVTVSALLLISLEDERPPNASAVFRPDDVHVGSSVIFDGTNSTDPDGDDDDLSYQWTIDGYIKVDRPVFKYSFPEPGNFTVALEVTDSSGLTDTVTISVTVLK